MDKKNILHDKQRIKKYFKVFELDNWNLQRVLNYVQKNFVSYEYSIVFPKMIQRQTIEMGPVFLTYYVEIDSAQGVEDTDYFYLHFYIDFERKSIYEKHDYTEKKLSSASLFICYYEENEIPDFTTEMTKHFQAHIKKLDLKREKGLYAYLQDYYTKFIS